MGSEMCIRDRSIPSHSLLLGMTAIVTRQIVGTTYWRLGIAADRRRFGDRLPAAVDTRVNGPSDPPAVYWAETPVLVSPVTGGFRSGEVRVNVFTLELPDA